MTATTALGRGRGLLGRLVILAPVMAPAWIEGAIHPRQPRELVPSAREARLHAAGPGVSGGMAPACRADGPCGWRVRRRPPSPERTWALVPFAAQLVLDFLWTVVFFGLHRMGVALVDAVLLWLAIVATARPPGRCDRWAELLCWPCHAWVGFAIRLNASIGWLDPAA